VNLGGVILPAETTEQLVGKEDERTLRTTGLSDDNQELAIKRWPENLQVSRTQEAWSFVVFF
jgi:hypothetical protein